jgi:ectoine hydroxylase-related dioxygenase (phytanoyl-CoA dioxygenase family)
MTDEALTSLGVSSKSLTQAQRTALDDRGYLVIPEIAAESRLERSRSAFDHACDQQQIPAGGTRHPIGLLDDEPSFLGLVTHASVLAAVRHVLRRPFHFPGVAGRDPMPGHGAQGLHIDLVDPGPASPFQAVTALVLLDDFTTENGATRLVPGSHRFRRPPPKSFSGPACRHPDQIIIEAPAGSVLVFNAHLWHSGTLNRTRSHRRVLQCSFPGRVVAREG